MLVRHFRRKRPLETQVKALPPVLLQELPDEALGQLARVAEELLVKLVVHGRDISQRLLLGVPEERRRSAQTETATGDTLTLTSNNISGQTKIPVRRSDDLQDVRDNPDAPVETERQTVNPQLRAAEAAESEAIKSSYHMSASKPSGS